MNLTHFHTDGNPTRNLTLLMIPGVFSWNFTFHRLVVLHHQGFLPLILPGISPNNEYWGICPGFPDIIV